MSDPFLGEIRIFGGSFTPAGWCPCDGRLLDIVDFPELFTLIGTTYGGNGSTNFAVPNFGSRVPVHVGNGLVLGETGGVEQVTLTTQQIPTHSHAYQASLNPGSIASPSSNVNAEGTQINMFIADDPSASLAANAAGIVGGSQPHENMQPFLAVNFIIAVEGLDPT